MGRVSIWGLWRQGPVPEPGLQFHIFGSSSSTGLPKSELGEPVQKWEHEAPVPEREPKLAPVLELASCRCGGQHIYVVESVGRQWQS